MSAITKLERQIAKKRQQIQQLTEHRIQIERDIRDAELFIQGIEEALKHLPKEARVSSEVALRPGSDLEKAMNILKRHGKPLKLVEILEKMGKEVSKPNKQAMMGQLSANVRQRRIFSRPAPGTFGLLEWENQSSDESDDDVLDENTSRLPQEFGKFKAIK